MKLFSVLVVFHLIILTVASAEGSFSNEGSIFGSPVGFEHLASADHASTAFTVSPFSRDYNLQYFPESTLADSTPYNSHNLFAYGCNTSDSEGMTSNDAGVQRWTPFLQTHFGSYNVVPEPGTFAILAFASLFCFFGLRHKG